ncbi:MAG: YggU family protein [Euryarchaeota archaeon]|nr:YggU family protein [Euryarchaeota archaeon]
MNAVVEVEDGILVDIEVSPKSKKFEIAGYNEWREKIQIRIRSVPQKGKANKEITREFSNLTKSPVEIVAGPKSQHKTLKIYNISKNEFSDILKNILSDEP